MTNFKKLTFSSEDLAEFLDRSLRTCPPCKSQSENEDMCKAFNVCRDCWLQYLNSEAEDSG